MRNEQIPTVLKEYRKRNKFTVNDVSIFLSKKLSTPVAPKTVYGWESGQAQPSADTLLTLCELYNITNILGVFGYNEVEDLYLSREECRIIKGYRLHPEMQEAVKKLLLEKPNQATR